MGRLCCLFCGSHAKPSKPVLTPLLFPPLLHSQRPRYSLWDFSRIDIAPGAPKTRTLQVPMGDVPLHIRGGTIVPMQQPGAVTRDVRLSPVTLVMALPPRPTRGGMDVDLGPLSPHALDEACGSAHLHNVGRLVSCGYLFMDSGEDVAITPDNSLQVRLGVV